MDNTSRSNGVSAGFQPFNGLKTTETARGPLSHQEHMQHELPARQSGARMRR